jgi:hypothetical protein
MRKRTARIVCVRRGNEHVAAVVVANRPRWACCGIGEEGQALALLAAVRWALEQRYTIETPEGIVARVAELAA